MLRISPCVAMLTLCLIAVQCTAESEGGSGPSSASLSGVLKSGDEHGTGGTGSPISGDGKPDAPDPPVTVQLSSAGPNPGLLAAGKGGENHQIPSPRGGANNPDGSLPAGSSGSGLAGGAGDKTMTTTTTRNTDNTDQANLLPDAAQTQRSQGTSEQDQGHGTQKKQIQGAGQTQHNPGAPQPHKPKPVTTTTTKPVTPDATKETLTRDISDGLIGSQSPLPTLQKPVSNGTPQANPTRSHTTEPAKSGVNEPSVKVTTTTTTTNSAAQPAQEPAAPKPAEQSTTQLQTLTSTTSTAAPTDSTQTSATFKTEFAKGESTILPTSLPKLSKALQSLDMKDSSIGNSAFFALTALATFVVVVMAPAC